MPPELPILLTAAEVADVLRVSVSTVYRWADADVLSSITIGNARRFLRDDIERLLAGERTG